MRIAAVLFSIAVFVTSHALGEDTAGVEGKVELPKAASVPPTAARYQTENIPIGQPEPPTAVVYLEGNFPTAPRTNFTRMPQKNLQFTKGLLPIQKGTTVEFPNLDDTYHNVFSYSKTKRFDLGRYRKDEKQPTILFDQPGVVKLYCEIHSHMRSVILVLDTPYFAKTDTNGNYSLKNLPPGKYTLKAWVEEKKVYEKPVDLAAGKTLHVDFPGK